MTGFDSTVQSMTVQFMTVQFTTPHFTTTHFTTGLPIAGTDSRFGGTGTLAVMAQASGAQADTYDIDVWGMLAAILLVAIATLISALAKLGVEKSMPVAALRAILQLGAMGFILRWVIEQNEWWWVVILMLLMLAAAVQITLSRTRNVPKGLGLSIFLTLAASMITMVIVVVEIIVRPDPWYSPRVILPLAGMMLGNSVTAVALALNRFFDDMKQRRDEVETMLALGATPREASMPSIRSAMNMGLTPTVASLASAGIVTIPGMMAGQILAGNDPFIAAKYQFVVLAAISALTLLCDALVLHLVYRRCFTELDQYKPIVPRSKTKGDKTKGDKRMETTSQGKGKGRSAAKA